MLFCIFSTWIVWNKVKETFLDFMLRIKFDSNKYYYYLRMFFSHSITFNSNAAICFQVYKNGITHLITPQVSPSEKFLAACAAGEL